jgi:hypothetical protein
MWSASDRRPGSVQVVYLVSIGRRRRRFGGAVDAKRVADLYAQGRTLRKIGAELGVPWTAVGHQLRHAGVTMRRGGPPAHPVSPMICKLRTLASYQLRSTCEQVAAR